MAHNDSEGIDLDDEGDIFHDEPEVPVGSLVPTGFPLKMAIGIAVLVLAVLAFMDDKK